MLYRLSLATLFVAGVVALSGCLDSVPGRPGAGGGGAAAWKPDSAMSNAYHGDLAAAKPGLGVTYVSEAGGSKTSITTKVVGKSGDNTLIEVWTDAGSMAYGMLYAVAADKTVKAAWSAAKDDKVWTSVTVNEPPKVEGAAADGPKPTIKESEESKEVTAGTFASHRIDTTVNVQGTDYSSTSWFSKDVPGLAFAGPKGGMVASEASGSKTYLEAVITDAEPTIPLPE